MTASASLPMPRRTEAAAVASGQAARPTVRGATPAAAKAGEAERPSPRRSPTKTSGDAPGLATQLPALAFAAVVAAALSYGWQMRDEGHLTRESGVGYWLGIGGASAMLLLLGYPLRKRLTGLKILGSVTGWFRVHMMLGVIGPALILLHANFKLGSLNSNVALLAMLTVASSGLIGRELYGRIHLGLYGRRAQIAELQADVAALKGAIEGEPSLPADFLAALDRHAERARSRRSGALSSHFTLLRLRLTSLRLKARLGRVVERHVGAEARRLGWSWRLRRRHARTVRTRLTRPRRLRVLRAPVWLVACPAPAAVCHPPVRGPHPRGCRSSVLIGTPVRRHGTLILLGVLLL
jgi:hypothetical protein